jgi:hypothetical protein
MRGRFWPFTEVQNGNHREVTRRMQKLSEPRITRMVLGWRLTQMPYNWMLDSTRRVAIAGRRTVFYLCYPWSGKLFQLG